MEPIKGSEKVFFGDRKADNVRIYLSKPSFDCGWYWGFGYLGNSREHYHLHEYAEKDHHLKLEDGSFKLLTEARNMSMYDALLEDYKLNPDILGPIDRLTSWKFNMYPRLYTFCELALTAYALKEAAEVLGRGGSHMTKNPCAVIIKNPEEVKRINEIVLPTIFNQIAELIEPNLEINQ